MGKEKVIIDQYKKELVFNVFADSSKLFLNQVIVIPEKFRQSDNSENVISNPRKHEVLSFNWPPRLSDLEKIEDLISKINEEIPILAEALETRDFSKWIEYLDQEKLDIKEN